MHFILIFSQTKKVITFCKCLTQAKIANSYLKDKVIVKKKMFNSFQMLTQTKLKIKNCTSLSNFFEIAALC